MGYLLSAKELLKYRYPSVVHAIQRARQVLNQLGTKNNSEPIPYWSIFLTYACTTDCLYCTQNYSFKNGRMDSPLKGTLPPESWLLLNDLPNRPEGIVITGGEPFLYKRLADVITGLSGFRQIQVVTNLTLDPLEVIEKVRSVTTRRVLFDCSYHDRAIDFKIFLSRVNLIKEAGLLGSVRIVDVNPAKTRKYIRNFSLKGIKVQSLFQVGMKGDEVLATSNPEASNLYRKPPVFCRTKLVLFAPNGDVYNCHTKLYWGDTASSFGNITTGFSIPDDYCICHDYGFCHPCQIGYINIIERDNHTPAEKSCHVLFSNPPSGVVESR